MNILGINPGHNGSAALVSNGETVFYIEEERLSRFKYDGNPFRAILEIIKDYKIDYLALAGTDSEGQYPKLTWTGLDPFTSLVKKFNPDVKIINYGDHHHKGHAACTFYNSGFEKAVVVVVDGAGSQVSMDTNNPAAGYLRGYEAESIWLCEYPASFTLLKCNYGDNLTHNLNDGTHYFDDACTITKVYEGVSDYLGFGYIEAGKTMGLSSYGKYDQNIPPLFLGSRGDKNIFKPVYPAGSLLDENKFSYLKREINPEEWHKDSSKLREVEKNLAWHVQNESQSLVGDLIQEGIDKTGITNVAIAGGYGLNCVANYYLKGRFPEINLFCEPIAHDGGTAIGVAKLTWHNINNDSCIRPQNSIYYGPNHSLSEIYKKIESTEDFNISQTTHASIAKLISEKNIVCMFQGRSEAGPRALGNRSILYDPTDIDGKDFVNKVKGREWFRPFAGTVLEEKAGEWFEMRGLKSSPFMMYAVNVLEGMTSKIPSITHVDNTCRVQTVNYKENYHYYTLIKEFEKITGVPILFNTSFNLAGDPLVETIEDALGALRRSELKYMYLPELEILVTKTIDDPVREQVVESDTTDLTNIILSE